MAWRDVCVRGRPAGGRVRQDDVPRGSRARDHDAGGPSPGILRFIREVVVGTPALAPVKPKGFPAGLRVQTSPGRGHADVHYEGRAADVFLSFTDAKQRECGNWLFDWCVANCRAYKIQGVIFGDRQWFSEMAGGRILPRRDGQAHYDHVHIELNGDGAARG